MNVNRRTALQGIASAAAIAAMPLRQVYADDAIKPYDFEPRQMGVDLTGAISLGAGELLQTVDSGAKPIVGELFAQASNGALVLFPDGELAKRNPNEYQPTERPFEPSDIAKLGGELIKREFPALKAKSTRHYLYLYNTSDEFTLATSRILESMLPGIKAHAEAMKIDTTEPQAPLVVVMFKTEDEFQAHQRMPDGVVAYYNTLSNRVYMYEESDLNKSRPDLAIQQSISTIAHEGVHQILHNIGVQHRLSMWPMWLSEGLAEYFAPTSTGARLKWKGAGQVNDSRMFELEQYLKSRAAEKPDGTMIEHTVAAAQLTSTGYASAWALTHYLAKMRRAEFNKFVFQVSRLKPFQSLGEIVAPGLVRENLTVFKRFFGDDLADLEKKLVLHLKKQPYTDPFQAMPHFVAMIVAQSGKRALRDANTFHSPSLAQKWLQETVAASPAEQRASAKTSVRVFQNRSAAEQFATQWLRGG